MSSSISNTNASLSKQYQRKTDKQHILDNPDTYIGSIENVDANMWIFDDATNSIILKQIEYIPGLYKLFDEGIVNSRDHVIRMIQSPILDKKFVTGIDINIEADGTITMMNDGNGIDIAKHPEYDSWIPEMIFGHLRTSTNYNTEEKKIVGGKNGFGFKLVLIWSTYGKIETIDHIRGLKYVQEFKNNLDEICPPVITKIKSNKYQTINEKIERDSNKTTYSESLYQYINYLLESERINWHSLCSNTNPEALYLLETNVDKIDWDVLSCNPNAIYLLEKNLDKICWRRLLDNPNAINILRANLDMIDWQYLCEYSSLIHIELLRENKDKIYYGLLSHNSCPNAIEILENNMHIINWKYLSKNKNAIHLLETNLDKIDWAYLSCNCNAIHLLELNQDKISWEFISSNPAIFIYDYDYLKSRMDVVREDLCKAVFKPQNEGRLWSIEEDF